MVTVAFEELEKAACCLLQIIKDTPELGKTTKVAIAGDMVMRKYLPNYRHDGEGVSLFWFLRDIGHTHTDPPPPQDIDLIVNSATSASLIRKKLLQHPMSPLVEHNQQLFYQTSSSAARIEVRLTPEMLCPFLPGAARPVHELVPSPATLPYVSLVDLVVFKMDACGLRDSAPGRQREARDAAALLGLAAEHRALDLNPDQARVVEECLADVLRHSDPDKQKAWWQTRLIGLCDPDARKPPSEVLSDLIEQMSLQDDADRRRGPALVGRTPSSSSKTSLSSMTSSASSSAASAASTAASSVTSGSPVKANGPGLPAGGPSDLTCTIPRRPRKFSTSQHSPIKSAHSRKKSTDQGRPKRHSQILGSLPGGSHAYTTSPTDDGSPGSPGLHLTGRFESTPGADKLVTDSYF